MWFHFPFVRSLLLFCLAKHWTRKFLSRRQTQRHRQRACIIFSSHSAHPKTHFRANYGTYTSTRRSVQSHLWHDQSVTFAVYFVVVVVARARTQMSQSIAQSARARADTSDQSNPCYQIDIKIINPHPITIRPSMNLLPICCNLLVIIIDELRALHNKNLHLTIARSFLGLVCLVVYCHKTQI